MVYNPIDTTLLIRAKKAGAHIISGIDMFIGQGLRQIELWTDQSLLDNPILVNSLTTTITGVLK